MQKVLKDIFAASQSKHATGVLYAGAVGIIMSDFIPTPAEVVYYYTEKNLHEKWKAGKISPEKYYRGTYAARTFGKTAWWLGVLTAVYFKKGDANQKAMFGLALVGAGMISGVIYKRMNRDFSDVKREVMAELESKTEFAGGKQKPVKVGQYRGILRKGNTIKFVA